MEQTGINKETVTIEDCMELYRTKGIVTELSNGKIECFRCEEG